MKDLYRYFRIESRELIEALTSAALELERSPSPDVISSLLRRTHTLKGAARIVKMTKVADACHTLEELLSPFRSSVTGLSTQITGEVFSLLSLIETELRSIEAGGREASPSGHPIGRPDSASSPAASSTNMNGHRGGDHIDSVRVEVGELDKLMNHLAQARFDLQGILDTLRISDRQSASPPAASKGPTVGQSFGLTGVNGDGALHPVSDRKFEAFRSEMRSALYRLEYELRLAYLKAHDVRLVPIREVATSLENVAHDSARSEGKEVYFRMEAGDHRIEAFALARIRDALSHLIRNAVAHGIEEPAQRAAAGKTNEGYVNISVVRHDDRLVFECRDDGGGLDIKKIGEAAVASGLYDRRDLELLDVHGASALLLKGGITTRSKASHVAGRGVGLEAVAAAARELEGDVVVNTERGLGTSVKLTVPALLESLDVIEFEHGRDVLAIPLWAVWETRLSTPETRQRSSSGWTVLVEGSSIPLVPFSRVWPERDGSSPNEARGGMHQSATLVLSANGKAVAVSVQRICGLSHLLTRTLSQSLIKAPLVLSAGLDAHGVPIPVLAPEVLVTVALESARLPAQELLQKQKSVLVVDDSLTTRILEQTILESAGYQVDLATSGEEGIEKARSGGYDLCIVDVEMPGMDGYTFVRTVRQDERLKDTPTVLVTSRGSAEDRLKGQQAGANAYIVKGEFEEGHFLRTVAALMG